MGDVLSQNEIDNLLAALSTGELDVDDIKDNKEKQVKNYDFARPSKFSKEHLRTLEIIFEHYGRLLSTNLPVYLSDEFRGGYLFRVFQCTVQSGAFGNCEFCSASGEYHY